MTDPNERTPARLGGHPGELVRTPDRSLEWRGEITPDLLSDLLGLGSRGPVPLEHPCGAREGAWIQRLWFDLERERMIVQLRDPSTAA